MLENIFLIYGDFDLPYIIVVNTGNNKKNVDIDELDIILSSVQTNFSVGCHSKCPSYSEEGFSLNKNG
jgi:hypothetical protein